MIRHFLGTFLNVFLCGSFALQDNASMSDCGVKAEDKVLYSGRTDRRKTLVPVAKSKNKLFAGKKRAVAAPELSFAVGRGLRQVGENSFI